VALLDHQEIPRKWRTLREYPTVLSKESKGQLPFKHKTIIDQVEALRTPAKHDSLYPDPAAVREISHKLDLVFEDNARQYLGIGFSEISMSTAVAHPQVREDIAAAEKAIEKEEYASALGFLRAAFDFFMEKHVPARSETQLLRPRLEAAATKALWDHAQDIREVNETWAKHMKRFAFVELGVNLADLERFDRMTPNVFNPGNPRYRRFYRHIAEELFSTRENASFALTFVLETVTRLESVGTARHFQNMFTIRARSETPVLTFRGSELTEVRRVQAGETVEGTRFGSGPNGAAWFWDNDKEHWFASFDAFEIIGEETREDYWERRRNGPDEDDEDGSTAE